MKLNKQFEFHLNKPLQYHNKGEVATCDKLMLYAPSVFQLAKAAKLKQGLFKAIKSIPKDNKDLNSNATETEFNADAVLAVLYMGDIEIDQYFVLFKDLLITGACKINGLIDLTDHACNELALDDLEQMLGEYIANFMIPAWMKEKKAA